MLRAVSNVDGYSVALITRVGMYTAGGLDVKRAVDQFSAMTRGVPMAGNRLHAMLYAEGDKQHTLKTSAEKNFDIFVYERTDMYGNFELVKSTYT